ncbi:hypothetical protein DXG03_008634, partial [Asterophora parasitica]
FLVLTPFPSLNSLDFACSLTLLTHTMSSLAPPSASSAPFPLPSSTSTSDNGRKRRATEQQEDFRLAVASQLETVTTTLQSYLDSASDRSSDPLFLALTACVQVLKVTHERYLQPAECPIEVEKRSRSIVIENLPESPHTLPSQRVDDDFNHVKKILDLADIEVRPETVFRMGERKDGRPRPLKILLPRLSSQRALLKNVKKITDNAPYSNVRIRPSLSAKERQEQFALREKRRELNKNGPMHVIYAGKLMRKDQVAAYKIALAKGVQSNPTTPIPSLLNLSSFPAFSGPTPKNQ